MIYIVFLSIQSQAHHFPSSCFLLSLLVFPPPPTPCSLSSCVLNSILLDGADKVPGSFQALSFLSCCIPLVLISKSSLANINFLLKHDYQFATSRQKRSVDPNAQCSDYNQQYCIIKFKVLRDQILIVSNTHKKT